MVVHRCWPAPGLSICTGVSSACSTVLPSTSALSASTSGCNRCPHTPTHSPSVERVGARPERVKVPSWRYIGRWSANLATSTCASSPAVGIPLSMTYAGTGRLRERLAALTHPFSADVALDRKDARQVVQLPADVLADAPQAAAARRGRRFVMDVGAWQFDRQPHAAQAWRIPPRAARWLPLR